ncbi:hypothetical protein T484DRAFT_1810991 [Baffinella frigidus]|nr:hypothetical protein T484DRAFT_1810991 [Cryptophyta sp. CCMP2293]
MFDKNLLLLPSPYLPNDYRTTEKLLLLPSPYLPNDYRATVQTPELATVPFPKDHPQVFCALHHVWKLDEQVFAIWMDLLRHAPESTLRLQECDIVAKGELRRFAVQN